VTWESSEIERTRGWAEPSREWGESVPRLTFARRLFPGLIVSAATAGVIVGDGWRSGTSLDPFVRSGMRLLASPFAGAPTLFLALAGLALHTFWMLVWGLCFTLVARSLRGGKLFFAAFVLAAGLALLARLALPWTMGAAELTFMSLAHIVLYVVIFAVALALGTRLARYA
jgi:hypothetical protein